ncbi:hypothetical protein Cni_G21784 [Canna indica]|uniref:DNA-3-methyladenine glycosylase I n=1 Tax=Canna indica TaxID=4628 RepID=A0AAQ3KQS7_9LILI|nr:hypothetical protein Cni_G21784 [Canna indica]
MCSSKIKSVQAPPVDAIDGRAVLQPPSNRVAPSQSARPIKKTLQKSTSLPTSFAKTAACFVVDDSTAPIVSLPKLSPPVSPTSKPARAVLKRSNDPNGLNSSTDKFAVPKATGKSAPADKKKPKKTGTTGGSHAAFSIDFALASLSCDGAPGSIAAAQREQTTLMQAQRKLRIAHYGRTPAKLEEMEVPVLENSGVAEEKKCSFITPNSDPLYIAYHDEEWGVPVHDDKMLFELLVLAGAQVGMDWTTILKKRKAFRSAFAEFDTESVSKFTDKQMASISAEYGLDLGRVRGIVENSKRIIEVKRDFGSLDKYLWGFVNHKPISPNYKSCRKIPVKTSKSESISKDMVRRGFRFVGPTVVHSFMQAAGLTNDHIVSCPRHLHCSSRLSAAS